MYSQRLLIKGRHFVCFVLCGVLRLPGRNEQNNLDDVKTKKYDHKLQLKVNTFVQNKQPVPMKCVGGREI